MTGRLKRSLVVLALVSLGCGAAEPHQQEAMHLLNRLGYGPAPGDLEHVLAIGPDAYLRQQLAADAADPPELAAQLHLRQTRLISAADLFAQYGPPLRKAAGTDEDAKKRAQEAANRVFEESEQVQLLRALYSTNQLQEVMTDFWFNHFNVFEGKGLEDHIWTGAYEEEAIRPYAMGRFRDLLGSTAKHPAMLYYLDNWQSAVASVDKNGKPKGGLNENFAREVMELHTLGVNGGYTQADVTELARILTGWTYDPKAMEEGRSAPDGFYFDPKRHDPGDKVFLGRTVHGRTGEDGEQEGEEALDRLAESPATARHIAFELAQYFVSDDPPSALVDRLVRRFRDSGGDTREVLKSLFTSAEFRNPANYDSKFKTPYQYVISSLRVTGANVINFGPLLNALRTLGMPLYGCVTPDGYKDTQGAWLNPDAMMARLNFSSALGAGNLPTWQLPAPAPAAAPGMQPVSSGRPPPTPAGPAPAKPPPPNPIVIEAALGNTLSLKTIEAVAAAPANLQSGLLLGSPEFMQH